MTLAYTNIKSLQLHTLLLKIIQAGKALRNEGVDLVCLSKTGICWSKYKENTARANLRTVKKSVTLSTSHVPDGDYDNYQAGGTMTAALGGLTGCVINKGKDKLGQWS